MTNCPACSTALPIEARFCPACGATLNNSSAPTHTAAADPPPALPQAHHPDRKPSPPAVHLSPGGEARFVPGAMVAGRYRVIGLLGKGGMGEVYRADDLKLGQAVALKFLPVAVASDGAMLARFHNEARIARQITHSNVCRVHDIGEVQTDTGNQHFLSMEYIDGEDLSTLLRRIGRLPRDKAVEIARQLCAGLAAAHEQGVLHRDLKPANVMLDGRGKARITDFGLAGLAEGLRGDEVRVGTPAYMAPEQLTGKGVTVKSDLYSLGLVLYEIFTGKRVFEARSIDELIKLHERSTPTTPSSHVKEIDPLVERVIMRCLEKDPHKRPASALQVAAALPGGDPLAAALAAGETPSPEMVAAAHSEEGALRPAVAAVCLVAVFLALAFIMLFSGRVMLVNQVPLEKSPEILAERAKEITRKIGYTEPPIDTDYGFSYDGSYGHYAQQQGPSFRGWDKLRSGQPMVIYFWYRQSPRYLDKLILEGESIPPPPLHVSGLTHLALDPRGRLVEFYRVPPQLDAPPGAASQPDWSPLFAAAELSAASFKPTPSQWIPPVAYDTRGAWEGALPDHPEIPLRIEAALYRGLPVYFQLIYPWTKPLRQEELGFSATTWAGVITLGVVVGVVLVAAIWLARRNLRLGRGDRRGAFKLAFFVFSVTLLSTLLAADHVPAPGKEMATLYVALRYAMFASVVLWLIYLALEPYVRRHWPQLLISWSRLLVGELRDPLIGRDVLIGVLLGLGHTITIYLGWLLPPWLGTPTAPNVSLDYNTLRGLRIMVMHLGGVNLVQAIFLGLAALFFLLLLYVVLRKQWLAAFVMGLIQFSITSLFFARSWHVLITNTLAAALLAVAVARFGLLTTILWNFFFRLSFHWPMTSDFSLWYASSTIFSLSVIAALAIYGFYTSLGGQKVFQGKLLEE